MKNIYHSIIRSSTILSRKGLYSFIERECENIKSAQEVLIVGSGGEIENVIKSWSLKNGFQVSSIDIDLERKPDIIGDVCSHDFKDHSFDVVFLCEVLEHLHSPQLAINNINQSLREGGRLVISVPFLYPIHDLPYDYYRFTRFGLEFLLKEFDEVQIKERNSWAETLNVFIARLGMDRKVRPRFLTVVFIGIAFISFPFVLILGKLIKTDLVTSGYFATAKKRRP